VDGRKTVACTAVAKVLTFATLQAVRDGTVTAALSHEETNALRAGVSQTEHVNLGAAIRFDDRSWEGLSLQPTRAPT